MASTSNQSEFSYSDFKLDRNTQIANQLKEAGFDIFLPQDNQLATPEQTLENELTQIKNSQFIIAILSDTRGVYLEVGFARALGKKIYAIVQPETRVLSPWSKLWYDYIATDTDDLIQHLKK